MKIIFRKKTYKRFAPSEKMGMLQSLLTVLFALSIAMLTAQVKTDSLEKVLESATSETQTLELQLLLIEEYLQSNPKKATPHFTSLKSKILVQKDEAYTIRYYLAQSIYYRVFGDFEAAKISALKATEFANKHPDSAYFKSKIYNSLGAIYDDQSSVDIALDYHLKALRYAEAINFQPQIATICAGIGRTYLYLDDYNKAKEYYLRAIAIKERIGEIDEHVGNFYTNLSSCYDAEGDYEQALYYLDKSIELKKKFNNTAGLSSSYNNKAYTLYLMEHYAEAEKNVIISIAYSDSIQSEYDKMFAYSTYAEILFAQNKIQKAEELMEKSINLSKKNNDLYLAKYNLDLMYDIYLKKGDYKQALDYYQQLQVVLDSVNSIKTRREMEKLSLEYETEKKNKAIELLNAENSLSNIQLKKSRQIQIAFLIVAILALVVLGLLWSRHKNKVKTDLLVKEALEKSYEKKLSETELQALRAQMNPHFLFNCLNSINSFIIKNEQEKASEYLSKFSMLIRKVLSNSKASKVTLANELEALELYIELEALRLNQVFEHKILIAKDVEKDYVEIPPLIIQPYVENSIWHGLMNKKKGKGMLLIDIQQTQDTIICSIEDNGIGRDAAKKLKAKNNFKRKSFGMNITKERLEHINEKFKNATHVKIIDLKDHLENAIGTKVIIKIAI